MHRGENFQPTTWSGPPTWTKQHANGNQNGSVSGAIEQSRPTTLQSNQPDLRQSAPPTGPGVWPSTSATTNEVGCVAGGFLHTSSNAHPRGSTHLRLHQRIPHQAGDNGSTKGHPETDKPYLMPTPGFTSHYFLPEQTNYTQTHPKSGGHTHEQGQNGKT